MPKTIARLCGICIVATIAINTLAGYVAVGVMMRIESLGQKRILELGQSTHEANEALRYELQQTDFRVDKLSSRLAELEIKP